MFSLCLFIMENHPVFCYWLIFPVYFCGVVFWHSRKRQTCKQLSRCWRSRRLTQKSSESGRGPMSPWCRRSVLHRTSRWHQRQEKPQHQSLLLLKWRPVYESWLLLLCLDFIFTYFGKTHRLLQHISRTTQASGSMKSFFFFTLTEQTWLAAYIKMWNGS